MVELHIEQGVGDLEDNSDESYARTAVTVVLGCEVCETLPISSSHVSEASLGVKELVS